jgi:pentatricopeptide repeat protein
MKEERYPPISDYGFIADCHSAALVSRSGSIDWCCMPRVDSGSCFGRLLGWDRGGFCRIAPAEETSFRVTRRYVEGTLVLETVFRTGSGKSRLLDCFSMREGGEHEPHQQILRIVEGLQGSIELRAVVAPCFDYGEIRPWTRGCSGGHFIAVGGCDGLLISGDIPLELTGRHCLVGDFPVTEGERRRLSIVYGRPEDLEEGFVQVPSIDELDRRLEETLGWWKHWYGRASFQGPYADEARRSAPVDQWKQIRQEIRDAVEAKGYDSERGVFIQAFGHQKMDASLLLLPVFGFVDWEEDRMVRTTDAIREELEEAGLLRRYASDDDGMEGTEGTFLACSFWLVECLARQGRFEEARQVFRRATATGNDLGLFSEEYDTSSDEMLGNFPQALTHLSLISAAVALGDSPAKTKE